MGLVKNANYLYRKHFDKSSTIDNSQKKKGFFTDRLKYYFKELIEYSVKKYGETPKFIQYTLLYDLQWMVKVEEIENILTKREINEFWEVFLDVLSYIDGDIIKNYKTLDNHVREFLLTIKQSNLTAKTINELQLNDRLGIHRFYIDIVNIKNGFLNISCLLMSNFNPDNIEIVAKCENKEFISKRFVYPTRKPLKFLSVGYKFPYDFDLEIPVDEIKDKKLTINVLSGNESFNLPIAFEKHARLSTSSNYLIKDNNIVVFKDNSFYLTSYSFIKMLKLEYKCLMKIYNDKGPYYTSALAFRLIYLILYPFLRNNKIWLFMDRRNAADDNGINLFKYAVGVDDDIKKVFVLNRDNFAFGDVSRIGKTIAYGSIKHRIYTLFAEKVISSHPDNGLVYPFWGNYPFLSGLVKFRLVFLQHGITKDNISMWLNKADKNISLIVTASKLELESFFKYPYNYHKDVPQLLGFPRYDALEKKEDYREIVIMPSWRRHFLHSTKEKILKSNYFRIYNSLINDSRLIDFCKKHGYKLIFKPHPNVYRFIELFETNDYVTIDSTSNSYNDIFTHASLIITDYSSIAFDFAYLKKPVIYYHYAKDYHFDLEESYFDYKTMGFGEVVDNHEELIDLIMEYVENECEMKDQYIKRVDDFFEFNDKNNCKRVYDAIKKMDYD